MPDLIITDAAVLLPDGTVRGGRTIEIKDGIIQSVREAKESDRELPAKEHISGRGKLVMPGLADCHMHTGQQLLKGGRGSCCPLRAPLPIKKWNSARPLPPWK